MNDHPVWQGSDEKRLFVGPLTVSEKRKANVAVNAVSKESLDRLKGRKDSFCGSENNRIREFANNGSPG
jgi:hypothetical protein